MTNDLFNLIFVQNLPIDIYYLPSPFCTDNGFWLLILSDFVLVGKPYLFSYKTVFSISGMVLNS